MFYGTVEDAPRLVDEFAGKGVLTDKMGTTERVNFNRVIGRYIDESAKKSVDTT